jgi:hypothetical protein
VQCMDRVGGWVVLSLNCLFGLLTSSWLRSVRNFLLDGVHIISLPFLVADIIMAAISAKFALRWCLDHLMAGWVGRFIITFPVWVADIIMAAISSKFSLRWWSYHPISFFGC